ncbi:hypothetical protein GBA52_009063 [Prunus armeniaca]|nr:hypothetical protein GBA52_009063 [Prunus armeniaca]
MSTTTDLKDPQTQPLKTCGCIRVGKSSKIQQRKILQAVPDHVATGFAYLSLGISTTATTATILSTHLMEGICLCPCTPAPAPAPVYPDPQFNSTFHAKNYSSVNLSNQPMPMLILMMLLILLLTFFSHRYITSRIKCRPFTLLSVVNAWKTDGPETVTNSDAKSNGTSSLVSFIAEISEGVSGELHHGILKAARRVVFDEIISNVINEFLPQKKAQRLNQTVKTCWSQIAKR